MKEIIKNLNLNSKIKLFLTFSLVIILIITILFYYLWVREQYNYNNIKINLAEQQKTLLNKLIKEVLLYKYNKNKMKEIETTIEAVEKNLVLIINGGVYNPFLTASTEIEIPKITDNILKEEFGQLIKSWFELKTNVRYYLLFKKDIYFEHILDNNLAFLQQTDKANLVMHIIFKKGEFFLNASIILLIVATISVISLLLIYNINQLKKAIIHIKELESILPICSSCKRIRKKNANPNLMNSWMPIEEYFASLNNNTKLTHGYCPECVEKLYKGLTSYTKTG